MATIVNPTDKDKETPSAEPSQVSGAASAISPGAPATPQAANAQKPQGSGRFTNLQQYMQANQGAGEKLAGQIGNKVGEQTQKLTDATKSAGAVGDQLNAERQRIAQATNYSQQIQQDPNQLAANDDTVNSVRQLATGQNNLGGLQQQAQTAFSTAQGQLGNVQQLASMTGNEAGRFELLRQALGRPSYTNGQQRLDQVLLQNGGQNLLGQLQQNTTNQAKAGEQLLGTTQTNLGKQFTTAGQEAKSAQDLINRSLGTIDDPTTEADDSSGAFGTLQSDLRKRQQDYIAQQQGLYDNLTGGIGAGIPGGDINTQQDSFNQDALNMLGLKTGQNLYNVDLKQVLNPQFSASNVTEQNIANPEDVAKYNALAKLSGNTSSPYLTNAQAGTAQGLKVDTNNLQDALKSAETQYNTLRDTKIPGLNTSAYDIYNSMKNTPQGIQAYKNLGINSFEDLVRHDSATNAAAGNDPWTQQMLAMMGTRTVKGGT